MFFKSFDKATEKFVIKFRWQRANSDIDELSLFIQFETVH
jgi:hypothetical protein